METKLNDRCPLGRELEMDELKNVSGGADDGTFWDRVIAGLHANATVGGCASGTAGAIQAAANSVIK